MNKVLTITIAALLTLSAVAQEKTTTATDTAAPAATGTVLSGTPSTTTTSNDSPLVAASKRANRKGRKPSNVITNATVKQPSKAHVTTTTIQPPPSKPSNAKPLPTEEQLRFEKQVREYDAKKAAEETAKKKLEDEARQRRLAAAADAAESDYVDPAYAEATAREAKEAAEKDKKPPQE